MTISEHATTTYRAAAGHEDTSTAHADTSAGHEDAPMEDQQADSSGPLEEFLAAMGQIEAAFEAGILRAYGAPARSSGHE